MEPAFAASPQSVIGHTTQKRPRYSFENIHRVSTSPVASSPPQQARRRIGRRPLSALTQDSDGPGRYSGFSRSERGADQADVGHHMEEYEEKHRHRLIASLGGVDSGVMSVPQQARGLGRVLGRLGQELGLQGHGHDEGVDGEEGDLDRVLPLDWDSMRCTYKCRNMVKAEVLEGMDRQAAEIQELKQAVDSLRSANEAGESERQRLKRRAEALEQARAGGAAREESLIQNSGAEALKAEGLIRQQLTRCAELQGKLQDEMQRRAAAESAAAAAAARADAADAAHARAQEEAQRELYDVQEELRRCECDKQAEISSLEVELDVERRHAEAAAAELDELQDEMHRLSQALSQAGREKQQLERQLTECAVAANSVRTRGDEESEHVIKQLCAELAGQVAEIREARKLKERHVNAALLQERIKSLEEQLARGDEKLGGFSALEVELGERREEVRSWEATARSLPGVCGQEDLLPRFAELQADAVAALANQGQTAAQLAEATSALERAQLAAQEALARVAASKAEVAEVALNLQRSERKVSLLTKERDGLKAILASYDDEEAVMTRHAPPGQAAPPVTPDKTKDRRIQELEAALQGAQEALSQHEQALASAAQSAAANRTLADQLRAELEELTQQKRQLAKETEGLRREVGLLESRVGKGDYNRATTRVLHLALNPEAEARRKALQDPVYMELEELREKVHAFEARPVPTSAAAGGAPGRGAGGPLEELQARQRRAAEEAEVLTRRVAALEKKEARYKEIFAEKITAFREACYFLFGYRVDMGEAQDPSTGAAASTFALRSMYADGEEEVLRFQHAGGRYEILATDYACTPEIERQVKVFLSRFHCIPAFTANLTMELFNKHTSA